MWDVYWVGVFLGVGVGLGVVLAGLLGGFRWGLAVGAVVAAAIGVGLGLALGEIEDGVAGGIGGLLGAVGIQRLLSGTLRRGGTRAAAAALLAVGGFVIAALAFIPLFGFVEAVVVPALATRMRRREQAVRRPPHTGTRLMKKLILVVIDGLTPDVFEAAAESRSAATLAELAEAGTYARATSTFPSLTPVCLASLATDAPDVHHIRTSSGTTAARSGWSSTAPPSARCALSVRGGR